MKKAVKFNDVTSSATRAQKQYNAQLLSTKELYDKYWGACIPLFQECIDRAMHGEMTVEDIYDRALKGQYLLLQSKTMTEKYLM